MNQIISVYLLIVVAVVFATQGDAKRGCNLYGHSCYGGHGKRSTGIEFLSRNKASLKPQYEEDLMMSLPTYDDLNKLDILTRYRLAKLMKQWIESSNHAMRNNDAMDNASNEILKANVFE